MAQLKVHLLDGFEHDRIVLSADGRVRAEQSDATTSLLLGTAGLLEAPVAGETVTARIDVPTRGLSATQEIVLHGGDAHLLVSVEAGVLACRVADQAPGFM
jgi:hypothetical protein